MQRKMAINVRVDSRVINQEQAEALSKEIAEMVELLLQIGAKQLAVDNVKLEYKARGYVGPYPVDMTAPENHNERNANMFAIPETRLQKARGMVSIQKAVDDIDQFKNDPYTKGVSAGMDLILGIIEGKEPVDF